MCGFKILCEIFKGTFEISHKILNLYIAKYAFYWLLFSLWLTISWDCDVMNAKQISLHQVMYFPCATWIYVASAQICPHLNFSWIIRIRIYFTAIGVSETWLNGHIRDLYHIEGYNLIKVHRHWKKVKVSASSYVKTSFSKFTPIYSWKMVFTESIFIELDKDVCKRGKNIIIGIIYRPPNTNLNNFKTSVSLLLSELVYENRLCYIMDDYIHIFQLWKSPPPQHKFLDQLHWNLFIFLFDKSTKVKKHSATLNDNTFTNSLWYDLTIQGIIYTDIIHYSDVIMSAMVSQIPSLTTVYSTVYSGADQRKHQSSASLYC